VSQSNDTAPEIWKECYAQCFQEKRHYDLFSWSVGAGMLAFVAFVTGQILNLPIDASGPRVAFACSVLPLLSMWVWIYERNRAWGEICNEVARDIERRFGIDGIQLRYMRIHLGEMIDRSNSDIPEVARRLPTTLLPGTPRPMEMRVPSMHFALYALALVVAAAPLFVALSSAHSVAGN
jgi:hypothetical protein